MKYGKYELKPCPFCGNDQAFTFCTLQDSPDYIHVVCDLNNGGCGCSGTYEQSESGAVEAWNRRPKNNKSKFEKFCDSIGMEKGKIYKNAYNLKSPQYRINEEASCIERCEYDETVFVFADDDYWWFLSDNVKIVECEQKKEPTEKDIEIMKAMALLYGYRYFGCDKYGDYSGFANKPHKISNRWADSLNVLNQNGTLCGKKNTLSHIQWEDDEPYYFEG